MFTVKHCHPSGEEFIYSTEQVNFVPASARTLNSVDTLWWYDTSHRAYGIEDGNVYVMNEAGKTVAKYVLAWPAPSGDEGGGPALSAEALPTAA